MMLTVRAIIACLVAAVGVARANIYGNNSVWSVSYGDQVSIPLYKLFETNKDYSVKYETTSNITRIISREPLFTREIPRNCKGMNLMDLTEAETPNRLSMICNGTDLYEVEIDQSNGKLKEAVLMGQFEAMSCFSADWNKALNIYAVFCQEIKGAGKDNFYVVHIVDRATKKVTGASRRNMADQSTYHFVDRVKVRFRDIFKDQSKTTKTTVVTVFDEPFADESINIVAKSNHFLLLAEVDASSKKPEEQLQVVDFTKDNTLNRDKVYKVLTMEVFERDFVIAFYNLEKQLKFGKCTLDLAVAKQAKISDCIFKTSKVEAIGHGMISFFASSVAAVYEKQEKKYLVCSIVVGKSTDTASPLLDNCNRFDGRVEPDTDVRDFECPKDTKLKVLYMTRDKKIDLGMDLITLSTVDPKTKTAEIFKAYANDTAELQNKFYTITDAFLDVFDKSRQEELLVQGTLLPKDGSVQFVVRATHQDKVTINQLTFTQYSRFLRAIDRIGAFPSLIGSLRNYFRIPIGRQYFSGNGINFNLKGSLDGRLVSNAGEFELVVDNLPNDQIDSFFYKLGYAALLTKDRRIVIVNCKKALGNSMIKLSCVKIGEKAGLNSDANERILATYDTQQILLIVTTYGQFIAFNKINHNAKVALEPGANKAYTQVTFKPNNAFILISVMVADSKGEIAQIKTYKMDEFAALESASFMKGETTLDKDNYSKAERCQDSAGQFCPRSIAYELQDTPILVVLNACKDKDRRLIRFSLEDPLKPQQLTNQYIRVDAFKKEQILMCTDLDTVTIAAIGDMQALGIGYESHNIQQTLGLQEMDIAKITDMKCLGSKAYALGFRDSKGSLKIATYFTDKLKKANDRLHSLLEFASDSGLMDFTGSEDNGIIVYSVFGKDKETQFRMVNLDGPELFVKSNTKTVINDATIDCTNGIANGYFSLPLNFKEQKNSVQVSSRTKNVELSKTKYNVGNRSIVNGPVFHFSLGAEVKTVSITQRVSAAKEYLSSSDARGFKIVFISRVATVGQFTFILAQLKEQSALIMRFNQANKDVTHNFTLTETCHNFEVTEEATGFLVALSCFYQNEKRIHFVSISKEHKFEYEGASSSLLPSNSMSLTKTDDKMYPYLLSNLDENNVMTIFKFYLNKVTDKRGTKISFSQIIHQVENGKVCLT